MAEVEDRGNIGLLDVIAENDRARALRERVSRAHDAPTVNMPPPEDE